ncbi:hypothetical protein [Campylobacter sp. RM16192]|uniref:hypothetical protein n=1 Tax=Campylobacter sp. RM16192 TaxID=1660080 RepID=UPI0014519A9F|nr:hypothetical protein [Campylobacter sp. RM16192]QCD52845.1 hypothetical protein CDOMC_1238 [Campylobacter sp. RM16192]
MTSTQRIVEWNRERGLLEQGYNSERESAFILEELYELLGFKGDVKGYARRMATNWLIADSFHWRAGSIYKNIRKQKPTDQDILDGLADLIVFATGAMAKKLHEMGSLLTPDDILNRVMDANDLKGSKVDEKGKIIKSDDSEQPKLV